MGIPGLLSEVQRVEVFRRPNYFKNAYFYVDGLNMISSFAKTIADKTQQAPYAPYIKKLDKMLENLRSYNPRQIEFYFDTYYPIDKTDIKKQRRTKNLKDLNSHSKIIFPAILAVKCLISKGIRVIYTGLEAEDEIIKVISDRGKTDPDSKHVVFSSDSDLFTFQPANAANVEIIPLIHRKIKPSGLTSINMGKVGSQKLVPKKYLRPVPDHLEARSIKAVRPMSGLLSFINVYRAHNRSKRSLALIYAPHGVKPHDIGIDIRRGTYGLIFRKWMDGNTVDVTENFQYEKGFATWVVSPLQGKELDDFKHIMTTFSIGDIVRNQFEAVAPLYNISDSEITAVVTYIHDLVLERKIKPAKVNTRGEVLFVLIKALLSTIMGWEEALGGAIQEHNLLWRIDVAELSAYV